VVESLRDRGKNERGTNDEGCQFAFLKSGINDHLFC